MKVVKQYRSHYYIETVLPTQLFCPHCGKKSVHTDTVGDYYTGEKHYCVACNSYFYLPGGIQAITGEEGMLIVEQILTGKMAEPRGDLGT
mgnify:CR=1 FL=1